MLLVNCGTLTAHKTLKIYGRRAASFLFQGYFGLQLRHDSLPTIEGTGTKLRCMHLPPSIRITSIPIPLALPPPLLPLNSHPPTLGQSQYPNILPQNSSLANSFVIYYPIHRRTPPKTSNSIFASFASTPTVAPSQLSRTSFSPTVAPVPLKGDSACILRMQTLQSFRTVSSTSPVKVQIFRHRQTPSAIVFSFDKNSSAIRATITWRERSG